VSDHIKQLAAEMIAEARAAERVQFLRVIPLPPNRWMGRCMSCPKKTYDTRRLGQRAFSSGFSSKRVADVLAWWDVHSCTEIHEWYRSHGEPFEFAGRHQ